MFDEPFREVVALLRRVAFTAQPVLYRLKSFSPFSRRFGAISWWEFTVMLTIEAQQPCFFSASLLRCIQSLPGYLKWADPQGVTKRATHTRSMAFKPGADCSFGRASNVDQI
jgi:hypothetical protein